MTITQTWRFAAAALAFAGASTALADHQNQNVQLMRASQIMGMKCENPGGEKLGTINNLAIDLGDGTTRFAILSHGGMLGVGDKLYAVPFKAFKFTGGKEVCILDVTKQRLEQAPEFKNDDWANLGDEHWTTNVYTYYTIKPDATVDKTTVKTTTGRPTIVKGSDAVGMDVHNAKNENLGDIEDLMIDVNSGRVGYAVLSFGGVLGIGDKLFAVPWQALSLHPDKKMFVLNLEKDRLKTAPGFDKKNWPDMTDLAWSKDVHTFYGSDPNWIYGYSGGTDTKATGGWGPSDDYNRKFNTKSVETITGTITDVGTVTPMKGMSAATQLTVQTDRETLNVQVGPEWYMQHQDRQFAKGEQVKIKGSRVDIDGKPVILASEVERGGEMLRLRDKNGHPYWSAWTSKSE